MANKKKVTTNKTPKRTQKKPVYDIDADLKVWPNWQPVGGMSRAITTGPSGYGQHIPSVHDLIAAFGDTVYACATLIANKMACAKIKLYVRTDPGQSMPKAARQKVNTKQLARIREKNSLHRAINIEEVTSHDLIDLLCKGNTYHNRHELMQYTQAFQDIAGNAFWHTPLNKFSRKPVGIDLLAPQLVTPVKDQRENEIVAWKFGTGTDAQEFPADEIIHFKAMNLADPYVLGMSPLQAAWGRVLIQYKELGFLDANLTNFGRPDAILAPQEAISPIEAERLAKDFIHRFRGQGAGGVFVADGPMTVTPISWPAKDFAELQLYETVKKATSHVYHIPVDIWEAGTSSNRSTREAAIYSLMVDCIKPRLEAFVEKLNQRLVPYFSDRLFFDVEDIVPEDKDFALRADQMLAAAQALTRNDLRIKYGYEPLPGFDEPLLPPGAMLQDQAEAEVEPVAAQPVDRSGQASAIAALQTSVYSGQIPREAGISNARIMFGFSPEEAAALFPDVSTEKSDESSEGTRNGIPTKAKSLELPDCRQSYEYDCGSSATQTVCQYYGVGPETEDEYVAALGTTPEGGTPPDAIVEFLKSLNLDVQARNDLTISDLAAAQAPVIVCIQDYEAEPADIPEERAGHWVVVAAANDDVVTFQDPSAGKVEMPTYDFLARWQDTDGEGQFIHFGIIVRKATKSTPKRKALQKKSSKQLVDAVKRFFKKQADAVIGKVKSLDDVHTKTLPADWLDLADWNNVFASEMLPTVALYYQDAAKKTVSRLGGSRELWAVVQPNLKEAVEKQVFAFADSTNRTTSLEIGQAIDILKKEFAEGLQQGEYKNLLADRVKSVFERASVERAYLIGHTEASRSQHEAMEITAIKSGVASGKKWILSSDACEKCLPFKGKVVPLGDAFGEGEPGPYQNIKYPPAHPGCRCDCVEVVQ